MDEGTWQKNNFFFLIVSACGLKKKHCCIRNEVHAKIRGTRLFIFLSLSRIALLSVFSLNLPLLWPLGKKVRLPLTPLHFLFLSLPFAGLSVPKFTSGFSQTRKGKWISYTVLVVFFLLLSYHDYYYYIMGGKVSHCSFHLKES